MSQSSWPQNCSSFPVKPSLLSCSIISVLIVFVGLSSQSDMETKNDMFGQTPILLSILNVFCMHAEARAWCQSVRWNYYVWHLESEHDRCNHNNFRELPSILRQRLAYVCVVVCAALLRIIRPHWNRDQYSCSPISTFCGLENVTWEDR